MTQCPACQSFVLVTPGTPCHVCGLSLVRSRNDRVIAVVPGHLVFDVARPSFAESIIAKLAIVTREVILDLSELQLLTGDEVSVVTALRMAAKDNEVRLVFARVNPSTMDIFAAFPSSDGSCVVKTVDDGLTLFSREAENTGFPAE
jgi:hypothetical protein